MRIFATPRPRSFNHRCMYYDERRERLKAVEQRAARDLGLSSNDADGNAKRLHEAFDNARISRGRQPLSGRTGTYNRTATLIIILALLLIAAWLLLDRLAV